MRFKWFQASFEGEVASKRMRGFGVLIGVALALLPGLILAFSMWVTTGYLLPTLLIDSNGAVFGIMGQDLVNRGHWQTLMYGQDYLISSTPYLYALLQVVFGDSLSPVDTLGVCGVFFGSIGLVFFMVGIAVRFPRSPWPVMTAGIMLYVNSTYVMGILFNPNATEQYFFYFGICFFLICILDRDARENIFKTKLWGLLGLVVGLGYISRPHAVAPTLVIISLMALKLWRDRAFRIAQAALLGGAVIGATPLWLHKIFRAEHWPDYGSNKGLGAILTNPPDASELMERAYKVVFELIPTLPSFNMPDLPIVQGVLTVALLFILIKHIIQRHPAMTRVESGSLLAFGTLAILMVFSSNVGLKARYIEGWGLGFVACTAYIAERALEFPWRKWAFAILFAVFGFVGTVTWLDSFDNASEKEITARHDLARFERRFSKEPGLILATQSMSTLYAFATGNRVRLVNFPMGESNLRGQYRPRAFRGCRYVLLDYEEGPAIIKKLEELVGPLPDPEPPVHALERKFHVYKLRKDRDILGILKESLDYFEMPYPPGTEAEKKER